VYYMPGSARNGRFSLFYIFPSTVLIPTRTSWTADKKFTPAANSKEAIVRTTVNYYYIYNGWLYFSARGVKRGDRVTWVGSTRPTKGVGARCGFRHTQETQ
jgi:hypothetical protein